jgi:hypothetical protein
LGGAADSIAAVRVVRKRLIAILRQVIAEGSGSDSEHDAEYDGVVSLLR